jgi:hypothetical protein
VQCRAGQGHAHCPRYRGGHWLYDTLCPPGMYDGSAGHPPPEALISCGRGARGCWDVRTHHTDDHGGPQSPVPCHGGVVAHAEHVLPYVCSGGCGRTTTTQRPSSAAQLQEWCCASAQARRTSAVYPPSKSRRDMSRSFTWPMVLANRVRVVPCVGRLPTPPPG